MKTQITSRGARNFQKNRQPESQVIDSVARMVDEAEVTIRNQPDSPEGIIKLTELAYANLSAARPGAVMHAAEAGAVPPAMVVKYAAFQQPAEGEHAAAAVAGTKKD